MEKSDCVERLMLFNERAAELTSLSFAKKIKSLIFSNENAVEQERIGCTLSVGRDGVLFQRYGPERDSIRSFVCAYRQFLLDRDIISIRNMSRDVYNEKWITPDNKNKFEAIRKDINIFLSSKFDMTLYGGSYTNDEIQNIFIYGDIIHIQEKEEKIFDSWKKDKIVYGFIVDGFVGILGTVLTGIVAICNLNHSVLDEIGDGGLI